VEFCLLQSEAIDGGKTVAVLMDVTQPLETLRQLLESELQGSLEHFEFWLQDTMKVYRQSFLLHFDFNCVCHICFVFYTVAVFCHLCCSMLKCA